MLGEKGEQLRRQRCGGTDAQDFECAIGCAHQADGHIDPLKFLPHGEADESEDEHHQRNDQHEDGQDQIHVSHRRHRPRPTARGRYARSAEGSSVERRKEDRDRKSEGRGQPEEGDSGLQRA